MVCHIKEPITKHHGIDTGSGDCRTDSHDHDHAKGEEHALSQLGDLEYIGKGRDHRMKQGRLLIVAARRG